MLLDDSIVKLSTKEKVIIGIASVFLFVGVIATCKIASDIGDHYFPKERFESEDFWHWKPQ